MRKLTLVLALFAVPAFAAAAPPGTQLGVRSGWGFPMGTLEDRSSDLNDVVDGQVPIWLDVGYRITPALHAAAVFQYGYAPVKDCPAGETCRAQDLRFGVTADYHFLPSLRMDPYVGLGVGFEILSLDLGAVDVTYRGFEYLNVQAGADWPLSGTTKIGPFLSFGLGQFLWRETDGNASDVDSPELHEWLQLGLRATFDL